MKINDKLTPFDKGAQAVQDGEPDARNPFKIGSAEFRNYELGKSFASNLERTKPKLDPLTPLRIHRSD